MSGIRTHAAATMLGVSPNTLRSWERRYGFPRPLRSAGGHRQYALAEIQALRTALADLHNVSSAVAVAEQRGEGPSSCARLAAAWQSFDEESANRLLEESLALRSIERTVDDVLLPAVAKVADGELATPEFEFAWRYATGWLSALKRLSPPAHCPEGVLLLDAATPLEPDALHAQALELLLRRAGIRTLALSPAIEPARLGRAIRAVRPAAIVLSGHWPALDAIGRVVYAVRMVCNEAIVFDFRGAIPDSGASAVARLPARPLAARDAVLARLQSGRSSASPAHAFSMR